MDQQSYEAAQQGFLECLLETEHEHRLMQFLDGLKRDPHWTTDQIESVEGKIREMLGCPDSKLLGRRSLPDKAGLSQREDAVLRLIARGFSCKEIAIRFDLSPKTIETFKMRGMTKLGLKHRADIVGYAVSRGWFAVEDGTTTDEEAFPATTRGCEESQSSRSGHSALTMLIERMNSAVGRLGA